MCGDVMIGRGIDQILPHPCDPVLYEPFVKNAEYYVKLAEYLNGPIKRPVDYSYIWGDAIGVLNKMKPDIRLINLETTITLSDDYWKDKEIHYRMNPKNIDCLKVARIDCCSLANNHILDWGYKGLQETLEILKKAGIKYAGAGMSIQEAEYPAILEVGEKGRVIIFSCGLGSSGIMPEWAAEEKRPGVNLLKDLTDRTISHIRERVYEVKRNGDVALFSVHWGGNWGYAIPEYQVDLAHRLIDDAGIDIIHGHSSHHVKGIEVYSGKLILYGCGDLLNDYEGIGGYEEFRDDLTLMYFADVNLSDGRLINLIMIPMQIKNLRLNSASQKDRQWLSGVLNREGQRFGTRVKTEGEVLILDWKEP
ncbi:MAG: CapA family protein [Thermodesulfovibrionales bacterium]